LDGSGDQRFTYRGVDPDQFLDMNNEQLMELFVCRIRRKFSRGLKRKPMALIKKLRKDEEVRESREADLVSYSDVRWRAIQTCLRHLTTSSLRRLSF
jgi:small subunit ribosomal protein S15e